jgi:hypothetical protein
LGEIAMGSASTYANNHAAPVTKKKFIFGKVVLTKQK